MDAEVAQLREDLPVLVRALLDSFARRSQVPILDGPDLEEACRDVVEWFQQDTRAVLSRSHWHTNGFMKFVRVLPRYANLQIRLHHWPRDETRSWSSIHNHRADFASLVLAGDISERCYSSSGIGGLDPSTDCWQLFDYRPADWATGGEERVIPFRRVNLRLQGESTFGQGDVRFLDNGRFHQVEVAASCTTLVVRGPAMRPSSQIAVPVDGHPKLAPRLEAQSDEEAFDWLAAIATTFTRSG